MKKWFINFCIFALAGCGNGTGTGNPYSDDKNAAYKDLTISRKIDDTVCTKLKACLNVDIVFCKNGVWDQTGVPQSVGVPANGPSSLNALDREEMFKMIKGSDEVYSDCAKELNQLNCTDSHIQGAYDSNSSTPYQGVIDLLINGTNSCSSIFK